MTSSIDLRLRNIALHPHCCNCGQANPDIADYADTGGAGFTVCCQESVCRREHRYLFGDGIHSVEACCWAEAELKFQQLGVDITKLPEIRRVQLD